MDRWRRRPEPAAIDITWVSCRGVRSSVPFHTPCLYASIYLQQVSTNAAGKGGSSSSSHGGGRRPHTRVKTATDRTGGRNPEWDAPLRLYLPVAVEASSSPPSGDREGAAAGNKEAEEDYGGGLLVRFELKSEVAVLGNVLSASAAVPITDLVADGRTHRVSYQLAGPDGRHPNGVISFSYAFHVDRAANSDTDDSRSSTSSSSSSDGEPFTPSYSAASRAIALPTPPPPPPQQSATASSGGGTMYPVIDWLLTEQVPLLLYPPATAATAAVTSSTCLYSPPRPATLPMEPVAVYPPPSPATSARGMCPTTVREPVGSGMYPRVDLDPVSCCYPPTAPPAYCGGGCGYAGEPKWDGRRFHS